MKSDTDTTEYPLVTQITEKTMKKFFAIFGVAAMLFATACGNKESREIDSDSVKIADLTSEYNQATSFNDSLMLLMGDIYTGLDSINQQEGLLRNLSGDNADRRAEIRQNLENIRARLNANRQLLNDMEAKLKNSNNQNAVLTKTIAQLKDHIAQQDQKIAALENDLSTTKGQLETAKGEITNLNTQVAETQEQVKVETAAKEQAQAETVAAENEANKVYYCIGTNKELKNNGMLEKKFLGATKVLKGNFNANYFTTADKRSLTIIPTGGKKVKVWSNMPQGSYQIVDNADGTQSIRITNPSQFWSRTPYLIVQIN